VSEQTPVTEFPTKLNPLPSEATAAARAARKARKAFAAVFSPFVRAMREATAAYLEARGQGVQREDALKGLEFALRETWPKHVSKFSAKCADCDDTGYQEFICRIYARCERDSCQRKGEEWQHRYVRPCGCEKGQKFQPKYRAPETEQDTIGQVHKPKRGFTRFGL
jgi:hypothetical protein